jgi:acyl carrier protein
VAAADMDWRLWGGAYQAWAASPRYRHLMPSAQDTEGAGDGPRVALARLDPEARCARVMGILTELLSDILRLPPEKIDPAQSLLNMGLDSLMAMEMQVAIDKRIGLKVSVLELMKGNGMGDLARWLADLLVSETEAVSAHLAPPAEPAGSALAIDPVADVLARIDHLSDEEIEEEIRKLSSEERAQA